MLRFLLNTLRIGTRQSPLALWQAEYVRNRLMALSPGLEVDLVKMTTQGDKLLDTSLAKVGGKGLFIKELEQALLDRRIDLAVHSTKDVTATLPDGLHLAAICERGDARDAFVSNTYADLNALPAGARVGTSSLRRQCQLRANFPALHIVELRGNVNTRLAKLDAGEFDAIILAAAGLQRLGLASRIRAPLAPEDSLPAVGQGAVCVESRRDDNDINVLLARLNHETSASCIRAERALNAALDGGCQVPIAGYAELAGNELHLRALVGAPDGSHILRDEIRGPAAHAEDLGHTLAARLLAQGAKQILDRVYGRG